MPASSTSPAWFRAMSSGRPSRKGTSAVSMPARHCASPASSTSSPISIARRCPTTTPPTRTMSRRKKDRPIARFTMAGSCSTDSRSRWCWPRIGKQHVSPLRWYGSNTGKSRTSRICKRSAAKHSSSRSPRSRAEMPRRRLRRPIRATRLSISSPPSTTIQWSYSPRRRSGTTASSRSTTRRKACRTCSDICAACSRCSRTRSRSCHPIWAAASAQACARSSRWCWQCWEPAH